MTSAELSEREQSAAEHVARGAALLDKKVPGWESRIDLSELDLGSECRCVVGQLFGDYWAGKDRLGVETACGYLYGFDEYLPLFRFAELDEAWITLIKARHDGGVL